MTRRTAARDPWVWGQVILAALILFGVPRAARQWGVLDPSGTALRLGVVLCALGLATLAAGLVTLGKNLTPATEPLPNGVLVTRGIYRVVRHPIYLGVATALAGYGFFRGGWVGGVLVFVVGVAFFEQKARVEERWLTQRMHGYEAYRARVPRILPFGWH